MNINISLSLEHEWLSHETISMHSAKYVLIDQKSNVTKGPGTIVTTALVLRPLQFPPLYYNEKTKNSQLKVF